MSRRTNDRDLRAKFQTQFSAHDPIALVIREILDSSDGKASIHVEHTAVRDLIYVQLMDGVLLETDLISFYLKFPI